MTNKLFALQYNNTDCLVHVLFTEEHMTINLLSSPLAEELGWSSFTVDHKGKLVNSLSPQDKINADAAMELYDTLMANEAERLRSLHLRNDPSTLRRTG